MSEIAIIVEGATCKCQYGNAPDKLKVLTNEKDYANNEKLIATTLEIGAATLEKNCFGKCPLMGTPSPPCKPVITEWQDYYEEVILSNGGYILLEKSKAICAISGSPCIEFVDNGQIEKPCQQNINNADKEVESQVNPLVDIEDMKYSEPSFRGITIQGKEIG